ncbi:MAG: hypothetical protein AAF078_08245 [Planctomycetota bacterium]
MSRWKQILRTPVGKAIRGEAAPIDQQPFWRAIPRRATDAASGLSWRRLRHTPWLDLVRGRLSGSLDWREYIANSELPEPLRALIRDLCHRTRLWRSEKVEVAEELITDFHAAIHAGAEADELVERFGEVKRAAKLIRRAKRRCRPLGWQVRHRMRQGLAVFAVVYVLAALWLAMGKPEPSVDYLATILEPFEAVPVEDRAWPAYRELKIEHRVWDGEAFLWAIDTSTPDLSPYDVRFDDPQIEQLAAGIATYDEYLAELRRIAAMPHMGKSLAFAETIEQRDLLALHGPDEIPELQPWPQTGRPSLSRLLLLRFDPVVIPLLGQARRDGRLLFADLHVAVHQGDGDRVIANAEAILGLGRLVADGRTLMEDLTSLGIQVLATSTISAVLAERPELFDDSQLRRLSGVIESAMMAGRVDVSGERLMFLDNLQHMFDPDSGEITIEGVRYFSALADQRLVDAGLAQRRDLAARASTIGMPVAAAITANQDEVIAEFERLWALIEEEPLVLRRPQESSTFEEEVLALGESGWGRIRYWPLAVLSSSLGAWVEFQAMSDAIHESLRLAIALELHRREHDRYPDQASDLVPVYLLELPNDKTDLDPDGNPRSKLKVVFRDGTPVIYGVGWDGDDDGGAFPETHRWATPLGSEDGGDWILFPPPSDG